MGVLPERIGPLLLKIGEAVGWLPGVDAGAPAERHAVQAQAVFEQGASVHFHRPRGGDGEVQPGRRQRLQIAVVAVEGEGLLDRYLDPLVAFEQVNPHPLSFAGPTAG